MINFLGILLYNNILNSDTIFQFNNRLHIIPKVIEDFDIREELIFRGSLKLVYFGRLFSTYSD